MPEANLVVIGFSRIDISVTLAVNIALTSESSFTENYPNY